MAKRDLSLDDIFSKTPPLDELCEHIRVGIKCYLIGHRRRRVGAGGAQAPPLIW